MAVTTEEFSTIRGDELKVTLFTHPGEAPSILLTVIDHDESVVPTAEFTFHEVGNFREVLRRLCEQGQREGFLRS